MPKMRVADVVAEWISTTLGVDKVFMVTGAGVMHLTDGVASSVALEAVCLHHEQSVSMAVEAYSRVTGKVGIALVSTGPAATNAVTGLAGAWQDSVACLFISGQVKVSETSRNSGVEGLRQFGVQELDIIPIVESITKYASQVSDAHQILYELDKALAIAKAGRPGPVWIEIPLDVQAARVDLESLERFVDSGVKKRSAVEPGSKIRETVEAFLSSERPVIVAGQGVRMSGANSALRTLAEKFSVPVVSTYLGTDSFLPHDNLYLGCIGVKGERAANLAVQKSDFLLVLGSSLHVSAIGYNYSEFAPRATKWIVDVDVTSHMKSTVENATIIIEDVSKFLGEFDRVVEVLAKGQTYTPKWARTAAKLKARFPTCIPPYEFETDGVNIYQVVEEVSKRLESGDVVVSDAGSAFYAVSQGVRLGSGQRYITSGAMATMGYSLPASIGIAVGLPESYVYAFTGDGSLHQNIQELGQLAFLGLPIALVVLNNDGYLSIRASQANYFDHRYIGTDDKSGLGLPNIAGISEAYGLETIRVENLAHLKKALDGIRANKRTVVVDVKTPANQPIVPTVSSMIDAEGKMQSRPIHDMTPLLDPSELGQIMSPQWS